MPGGQRVTTAYASGDWVVREGCEAAFGECWSRFLDWTTEEVAGLRWALLLSEGEGTRHFVSVAEWDSPAHRDAWRTHPDFARHLGPCRALCEESRGADYSLVAAAGPEPATAAEASRVGL
jgi:heme-degrading monooxygenase HmoA